MFELSQFDTYRLSNDIKLGIISNYDQRIYTMLRDLGLDKFFSFVVIPNESGGFGKPRPEIFNRAFQLTGLSSPNLITHIGNNIDLDYYGAINAGFNAVFMLHEGDSNVNDTRLDDIAKQNRLANGLNSLIKLIK